MKHLKIEIKDVEGWGKVGRIKEQTHRGEEFGEKDISFETSNRFWLTSIGYPSAMGDGLCVRGDNKERDNHLFIVSSEKWLAYLRVAVSEYNWLFRDKSDEKEESKKDIEIIE